MFTPQIHQHLFEVFDFPRGNHPIECHIPGLHCDALFVLQVDADMVLKFLSFVFSAGAMIYGYLQAKNKAGAEALKNWKATSRE